MLRVSERRRPVGPGGIEELDRAGPSSPARPHRNAPGVVWEWDGGCETAREVEFRQIDGTRASIGWAGVKTVVADRPRDAAGGLGLGLSGGELQALA